MTAYNAPAVADAVIAYQKPITLQQGRALRDNPKAMGEADASVPSNLLPTVLLGTLTTTSGTTQTLSSLVLTPYRFLRFTVNGVSSGSSAVTLRLGTAVIGGQLTTAVETWLGTVTLDLTNGVATGLLQVVSGSTTAILAGASGYTAASTSISFGLGGAASFDAGSILVYGEK